MSTAANRVADVLGTYHPAIPLERIEASETNPRKHFDKDALQELADSIAEKGVIQPIVVRPHPKPTMLRAYQIVAGERRYRASKLAGVPAIPAIERDLDDRAVLEIQVIENLQRVDIHPLDEALGYKELIEKHGYDVDTLAAKVGKSASYIYQRLKLAELVPAAQKLFVSGIINAGHAILIARLAPKDQEKIVCEDSNAILWDGFYTKDDPHPISVRRLAQEIRNDLYLGLERAPWKLDDAKLVSNAGACSDCPKRSGANPNLFSDISDKNICTDRACYKKKQEVFITNRVLLDQAVRITAEWSPGRRPKAAYYIGQGATAINSGKDRCEYTRPGVYVDGSSPGNMIEVCIAPICKKHGKQASPASTSSKSSFSTGPSPTERKAEEVKRNLAHQARLKSEHAIITATFDATSKIGRLELEMVAVQLQSMHNCGAETSQLFLDRFKKSKLQKYGPPKQILQAIRRLDDQELAKFICGHLVADGLDSHDCTAVDELLKARKIDRKAIEKKISAELQKPPVQTSAISKAKKKAKGK